MNPCRDEDDGFPSISILTDGEEMGVEIGLALAQDLILVEDGVGYFGV